MKAVKQKSLKKDRYSYMKDDNTYWFANGSGIDCFHRLRLTKKSLELLHKIGTLERRAELPGTPGHLAERCANETCVLWEKFREQFNNPYELDVEFVSSDCVPYRLAFIFYDYDYCYYLEWNVMTCMEKGNQGAWSIVCTKSFYVDSGESEVEMDTP